MKPTGWFQVAWSDEIGVGDVHTMKYFDQEMITWRSDGTILDYSSFLTEMSNWACVGHFI